MKNLFSRKPVDTDVRPLALTEHHTAPGRITPISNPDTRMPLPHSANRVDPHDDADSFRALVRQKVAALAAAGAIDQDNLEALSREISSWFATWRQKVEQDHTSRTEIAQLLLAQTVQDKTVVASELAAARAERCEILADRADILHSWGFSAPERTQTEPVTAAPATASRVRAIARGEGTTIASSATEPLSDTDASEVAAPSVIDFPVAAPAEDPTASLSDTETDSEELSA